MIIEALTELSSQDNCQVIITTHVPGIAGLLSTESLRYIDKSVDKQPIITNGEGIFAKIANDLGVLADKRIKILVCVEGPHDVKFIKSVSRMLSERDHAIPDISNNSKVAIIPLGGSTLVDWVKGHYLREFQIPEIHIYDKGTEQPPKYEEACRIVNARGNNSLAILTGKSEIENYLHPQAIRNIYPNIDIQFGDNDDVPFLVAKEVHEISGSVNSWDQLKEEDRLKKISRAKARLCGEAADTMTYEQLIQRDPNGDIISWLREIANRL